MGLPSNSVLGHLPKPSAMDTAKDPETGSATLETAVCASAVRPVSMSVSSPKPCQVVPEKTAATSSVPAKRKHSSDDVGPVNPEKPFMSKMFDIYVGTERKHFTAHEEFLARSPKLKLSCTIQKTKKGHSKVATALIFPSEHPNSFGRLLEYLYFNIIAVPASEPLTEARQLAELFSVAKRFHLPQMQEDIIFRLDNSEMSSRISVMEFFGLAEDLFSEGMVNGLQTYFAKAAQPLIKTLDDEHLLELERMVAEGGDFAQAVFFAYRETFRLMTPKEVKDEFSTSSGTDVETNVNTELQPEIKVESGTKKLKVRLMTPKEVKDEFSTSSGTDVEMNVNTELQPEIKVEPGTKKLKVSPPSWVNLSEADKKLVQLRAETSNWNQISQAWYKATGIKASIKALIIRYSRITTDWWQLKLGDKDRLLAAEAQVEAKFRHDMWGTIADVMVEKGADRYAPAFLRETFAKLMEAKKASDGRDLTGWRVVEAIAIP